MNAEPIPVSRLQAMLIDAMHVIAEVHDALDKHLEPASKGLPLSFRARFNPSSLTAEEMEQYLADDQTIDIPPGGGVGRHG